MRDPSHGPFRALLASRCWLCFCYLTFWHWPKDRRLWCNVSTTEAIS